MKSHVPHLRIAHRGKGHPSSASDGRYRSQAERRAEGKALRDTLPRTEHSGWTPHKERRDPVDIVLSANEGRLPELLPIRHGRMAESPFAFYRGSAAIMAADLAHTPSCGLRVQACGDAHLSNFGVFATPERSVIFDVNDLDETLPAPWEWDLKRLTASVVLAGRHIQLKQRETMSAARAAVRSYREHIAEHAFMKALDIWYEKIDIQRLLNSVPDAEQRARMEKQLKTARARTVAEHDFPKLAEQVGSTPRIKDNPPLIYHHREINAQLGREELDTRGRFITIPCPITSACSSTVFISATWR
jgi:hypothetical protein